jgi:hypothetical protein
MKKLLLFITIVASLAFAYSSEEIVSITFEANTIEQMNKDIISYVEANGLAETKTTTTRTVRERAALNVFEKIVPHIEFGSFDYIKREDLKNFVNYCHDANGNIKFYNTICANRTSKLMYFQPSAGSENSNIVK